LPLVDLMIWLLWPDQRFYHGPIGTKPTSRASF
jgi:hypothetical protein